MFAAHRFHALAKQTPELSLALATLLAGAFAFACRSLAAVAASNPAELDGFVFLAAVYWIYSVVGYLATLPQRRRAAPAPPRRPSFHRAAIVATTVAAGLLGMVAAL
jgi:hypothetical protein